MEIKSEKAVTTYEAQAVLNEKEKERELGYEQKNAFEYLNKFCKLSAKAVKAMASELKGIEKLQDKHVVSIIEMLPRDKDDLRLLFANERIVLGEDEEKKILEAVKKHA